MAAPAHPNPPAARRLHAWFNLIFALLFFGLLWALLSGCTDVLHDPVWGPGFHPANFTQESARLPRHIERVALLPIAPANAADSLEMDLLADLQPALAAELTRAEKFQVVPIAPESLQLWTGRPYWLSHDRLPLDFFAKIREKTGCDAVFFGELTHYRLSPPLSFGWRFELADAQTFQVWWSSDELFNAGEPRVVNAARRYYKAHRDRLEPRLADSRMILESPRDFAHYSASALVETLPPR